ncbi:prolyl hydroxylase family protein [Pseudoalteromonas aurantia]|uniref:Proline hydroxylase n=1 Tax=Pseudoalteromonas aurantia TaxID=43654 RepID=A0A5S3V617_9GAMM|nr:2OG-Fe(II) oxygenase [Pseudoalteromonas aurantia]TMO66613.1 proline hydroxylase [Pseudoalteromonas aurantia]
MDKNHREWVDWYNVNLKRGCCTEEMVQLMCAGGIPLIDVKHIMGENYPDSLDFSNLTKPSLINSYKENKVNTDKVQMYVIDRFMDNSECNLIISLMETALQPSEVTVSNGDERFRTSTTCYLGDQTHPFVGELDIRIAQTMGFASFNSEAIQGQKYDVGQEFKAHTDFFQPGAPEYGHFTVPLGQRTWSFMVYLNDTEEGGETEFPKLGLSFRPKKGSALVWNNLSAQGYGNEATLHHAKPVVKGNKYVITKWFRTRSSLL